MIRVIAAGIVWPVALAVGWVLWTRTGPDIEAALDPVLVDQSVTDVIRSGDTVCWIWRWVKDHDAQAAGFSWSFTAEGTSIAWPAITFRREDGVIISENRVRPPGPGQSNLCAEIPPTLSKIKRLKIKGSAGYRSPVGPWIVWHEMPDVPVPPSAEVGALR